MLAILSICLFFFFNDTATTEIYTLSLHDALPIHILFTEGTPASFDSTAYGRWSLGEAYGRSMINDFNSGTEGWTDWNILLDEHGGPNHVGNFCLATIHADTLNGKCISTNPCYYI